jgi:aminopeptidase N
MHVTGQRLLRAVIAPLALVVLRLPSALAQQPASRAATTQPAVAGYYFYLELPARGKHIIGRSSAIFVEMPRVDSVTFNLDASMHVTAVETGCGDVTGSPGFLRHGDSLRVLVDHRDGIYAGLARCMRVAYDGEPTDGLIIGTDSAGRWMAFGDNFPNRARHWLPTVDRPSQKAKVAWEINAPDDRTVVANGFPDGMRRIPGGRVVTKWTEDRAIPTYDMVIAVAPLVMTDLGKTACGFAEGGGCVPQMVYTAPEQAKYMPGAFARAGDIVAFYSRTIGPYPYEKLAHVQSTTRYGGMENASAIFYYDRAFRRANGIDDGLIAHETAHMWFGNSVTEREWAHLWLSEGFATFFAALWAQHARGDTAYAAEMVRNRNAVVASPISAQHAVIDSIETDPNKLLNANSYQKGGVVLHTLRAELGDSAFFGGIRRYYAEHAHANALTQDLQRAMEASSGRSLGWFFDQWLRRPGWAEVQTSWTWDQQTGRVTLTVEQGGRFGSYRLSLPVEWVDVAGARHTVNVQVEARASQAIALSDRFLSSPASVRCAADQTMLLVCKEK